MSLDVVIFMCNTLAGSAGAVDEDSFLEAFENVKKVTIFSGRALEDELSKIHTVLNNSQADWKQRVENLSLVRALLVAGECCSDVTGQTDLTTSSSGAAQFDELTGCLKSLEYPFESCVKDLRSQVVRECCITIAFLSQCLKNKVSHAVQTRLRPY